MGRIVPIGKHPNLPASCRLKGARAPVLTGFLGHSYTHWVCLRGVAQSVARGVWDAEAGGSSPLTPTFPGLPVCPTDAERAFPDEVHMTELRRGSFESLVSQPETHAVLDLEGDGRVLLVLFGGIAGGVSMPVFEFFRLTSAMPGKKAFLRDPLRSWYQRGVPGIGETGADVRDFLNGVIDRADVDRVVMAGASAGGYAAMLFGAWCMADEVIAFSPQTFIDPPNRERANDTRWAEQIDALHLAPSSGPRVLDLLEVLRGRTHKMRFQVHVSEDDPLDIIHAERISDVPGVEIIRHRAGGHRLVKTLRDRGLLQPMLEGALSIEPETKIPDHPQ